MALKYSYGCKVKWSIESKSDNQEIQDLANLQLISRSKGIWSTSRGDDQ